MSRYVYIVGKKYIYKERGGFDPQVSQEAALSWLQSILLLDRDQE